MDTSGSIGGLLPLWILCAPLVWALWQLTSTPKTHVQSRNDGQDAWRDETRGAAAVGGLPPQATAQPAYGTVRR